MFWYILRRLLFIIPTLFGIMVINFAFIQLLPGGPVEQIINQMEEQNLTLQLLGGDGSDAGQRANTAFSGEKVTYQGSRGLPQEFLEDIEAQFGFNKPPMERFFLMIKSYAQFDFGESYFRSIKVYDLVLEKLPVSITLGLWSTILAYLISIPLGIKKATNEGSKLDTYSSAIIVIAYSIPGFL